MSCDGTEEPAPVPSIKCTSCGNRILLPSDRESCANCGALISQQSLAAHQAAMVEQLMNPFDGPEGPPPPGMTLTRQNSQSLLLPAPGEQEQATSDEPTDKHRAVQLYQPLLPQRRPETLPYHPYQSTELAPIDPRGGLLPAVFDPLDADRPSLPLMSPLPKGFPSRPPDMFGTVIHTQSQMENPLIPDNAEFIFKMIRDLVWAVPQENQQPRSVHVTTVRVRTSDGSIKDGRIEGYMRGVNISLGDTISVWGHRRRGLLLIYRGYNHTSKGVLKTTASSSCLVVFLLLVGGMGLGYYFLMNFLHWHMFSIGH